MTFPSNSCWHVLQRKAQTELDQCRQAHQAAQAQLEQLHASMQRIDGMVLEYQQRHGRTQQQTHHMPDSLNYRQFLTQLQQLHHRVARDLNQGELACRQSKLALAAAEKERLKMTKLVEQEQHRYLLAERKQEQKRNDELGIQRYQWGNA